MAGDALWIFGYGSLVWRPAFAHRHSRPARIRGFRRRFWQGSTDHRGVPGAPGRVATLVRETEAVSGGDEAVSGSDEAVECWGRAYEVAPADVDEVIARLDHREKGGYERVEVELRFCDAGRGQGEARTGLLYLATAENPNYLGPAALPEIAAQVLRSRGPSGHNVEYVLRLAEALRRMRPALTARCDEALALAELVECLHREEGAT